MGGLASGKSIITRADDFPWYSDKSMSLKGLDIYLNLLPLKFYFPVLWNLT